MAQTVTKKSKTVMTGTTGKKPRPQRTTFAQTAVGKETLHTQATTMYKVNESDDGSAEMCGMHSGSLANFGLHRKVAEALMVHIYPIVSLTLRTSS